MSKFATFEEVESIRCRKCASGPNCKCWIMAGSVVTGRTKLVPHEERAWDYFESIGANPNDQIAKAEGK